ncbi:FluC/FEX family fluoride channel [Aspergillus undulatus]|uniref:FluC/FEX family fluoride channel n=1 Tax=Aspergillus undulatus TaxID=1810928 RepID=UPI003CCCFC29
MSSDNHVPGDTVESRLPETQARPPTAESAPQRQSSPFPEANGRLTSTTDKPSGRPEGAYPEQDRHEPEQVLEPLSSFATTFYTLSYLIFFSIFGTLARLGLQALTFYPGAPVVTGVLWANVGGSLLMGFFLEDKNIFREEWGKPRKDTTHNDTNPTEESKRHTSVKKTIPLYIGLTTGFCGSFTSFSSFIRDIFLALSNDLPGPSSASDSAPNGGYSFMALVAVLLTTVSLSLGALVVGSHLTLALDGLHPRISITLPFRLTRCFIDPLFVLLGIGCWVGSIFLSIFPPTQTWRGDVTFAIVFAPLGTLTRFYLSLFLNARIPTFPLGTFAINITGTIILAMCYDLQRVDYIGASSLVSCQVLQGVMDGFCGCATTVSTWVAEMNGLKRRRDAYVYGGVSVAVALGFFVVISGSLRWTVGFGSPVCG